MVKKKVVILMYRLELYRVPIFNELAKAFDLTLVCENADEFLNGSFFFKITKCSVRKVGPFTFYDKSIKSLAANADVVVGPLNIRCIDLLAYALNPFKSTKLALWGIGVNGSYKKSFGSKDIITYLRVIFASRADSIIFYSNYPIELYKKCGIKSEKLFVANNTVALSEEPCIKSTKLERNNFIFVGSLYREKGVSTLIDVYADAFTKLGNRLCDLVIVGKGPEFHNLQTRVNKLGLSDKIIFTGAIYEEKKLLEKFKSSVLCISPNQAGLSVLKSMGYGVPFVTKVDALTGGERLNIQDKINGLLYLSNNELEDILIDASINKNKYYEMGLNAYDYYHKNRTPSAMVKGLSDAIHFAMR